MIKYHLENNFDCRIECMRLQTIHRINNFSAVPNVNTFYTYYELITR